jgi:actin related protein 2/3 complex subunit 1A/1B
MVASRYFSVVAHPAARLPRLMVLQRQSRPSVRVGHGGFTGSSPVGRLNGIAFKTIRNADPRDLGSSHGEGTPLATDTELFTVHQNTITKIRPYDGALGAVSRVSTCGVDGELVIWSVNAISRLGTKLKALRLG